ncbi:hypothetical protein [Larkinella humicola]|uniref:Uncharacterized protein n=1 Tax=Larkinella humicola TaxID=2607654 RepID=A0A5N1JM22_9BACT|nr:hypothetical protein [Larkinella humicola]KAA9357535.1 hypothetical protein F0P93_07345 [Larkinella humicola]
MKSTLALFLGILMLAGSLFPQTDVEKVYKLPGLLAHYQLHRQAAKNTFDFWQFLSLHYAAGSEHAKTPHKGVKLPMYNHLSSGFVFVLTEPQWQPIEPAIFTPFPSVRFSYENRYSFQRTTLLFQPPRFG